MSDSTSRAIRAVKAQGIRDAAEKLLANVYNPATTQFARDYNFAMRDAADFLIDEAAELENTP